MDRPRCGLAGTSQIVPSLVGGGPLTAGSSGYLLLTAANPLAFAVLFAAGPGTPVPFKGGTLCAFPIVAAFSITTSALGGIPITWASWAPGLSGATLTFQSGIQDPGAIWGVSLSNAVQAEVP